MTNPKLNTWKKIAQVLAVAMVVGAYFYLSGAEKPPENFHGTIVDKALDLSSVQLLSHDNRTQSLDQYRGQWVLLFFGYTQCPDVCPTTLAYLTKEYGELRELRKYVQVVMVSVDPKRDKPEDLKAYVQGFDPTFVGTTGKEEDLQTLVKQFNGFFHYHESASAIQYTVEHPGDIFLISPEGKWHSVYRPPLKNGILTEDLRHLVLEEST